MNLVAFLNLIRWKNLLLIIYVQIILKFLLFPSYNIETNLSTIEFLILLVSVVLITAAGNIINDIFDLKADLINKPKKVIVSRFYSIEKSKKIYFWVNTIGLILGIGLSLHIEKPTFSFIFIGTSLLLYYYSKKLKQKPLIGNLIVSFLIAFSIILLIIFDLNTAIKSKNQEFIIQFIYVLSFFAFSINLIRELVKDIEDVNGDYTMKMNTLPILIGRKRTRNIVLSLLFFPLLVLVFIIIKTPVKNDLILFYLWGFSVLPLAYCIVKLRVAKSKKEYKRISNILKIIMFLGISSILIFSIKY